MSIDFSRYLSLWMFGLHQPEREFWKTMNPRKLHSLLNSWYQPQQRKKQSLSEYFSGG